MIERIQALLEDHEIISDCAANIVQYSTSIDD